MNFPRRNKSRFGRLHLIIFFLIVIICLSVLFIRPLREGFSSFFRNLAVPAWVLRDSLLDSASKTSYTLWSKDQLIAKIEELEKESEFERLSLERLAFLERENKNLREVQNFAGGLGDYSISNIVARPNQTPQDTFIIEGGRDNGFSVGDLVFSEKYVALGRLQDVGKNTSVVRMFSAVNISTPVLLGDGNISLNSIGEGGQNFSIEIPAGLQVFEGEIFRLSSPSDSMVGVVETIELGPGGIQRRAIARALVNINTLEFVIVDHD